MFYCQCECCGERLDNGGIFHLVLNRLDCKPLGGGFAFSSGQVQVVEKGAVLCEQCMTTIVEVWENDSVK